MCEVDGLSADGLRLYRAEIVRLTAEVDRLTAELAESRAAYDAVCRHVGTGALRPASRPAVGSIIVDSNGNEAVVLGYNDAGVALIGTAPGHIEDARRQADGGAA